MMEEKEEEERSGGEGMVEGEEAEIEAKTGGSDTK